MTPKDADGIANSEDPDLGLHCSPDMSDQKLRIIPKFRRGGGDYYH